MNDVKRQNQEGFSLIEIVIALAIFSTGILVLMGVLPQNLEDMRTASSKSMERRIAQNVIGELMLNEWERLHLFNTNSTDYRYFDAQGIEITGFNLNAIFTARVRVLPRDVNLDQDRSLESVSVSQANNQTLPDDENISKSTSQHARRVIVEVTSIPQENFDFDDPRNEGRFLRVGTVVANFNEVNGNR